MNNRQNMNIMNLYKEENLEKYNPCSNESIVFLEKFIPYEVHI